MIVIWFVCDHSCHLDIYLIQYTYIYTYSIYIYILNQKLLLLVSTKLSDRLLSRLKTILFLYHQHQPHFQHLFSHKTACKWQPVFSFFSFFLLDLILYLYDVSRNWFIAAFMGPWPGYWIVLWSDEYILCQASGAQEQVSIVFIYLNRLIVCIVYRVPCPIRWHQHLQSSKSFY